jgi:hypothetical protein
MKILIQIDQQYQLYSCLHLVTDHLLVDQLEHNFQEKSIDFEAETQ